MNTTLSQTNFTLNSQLEYAGKNANDIWGYADDDGNEYALVGLRQGLSIVDVTNPDAPVEIYSLDRPNSSVWRDLKEYNGYVYAVDDQDGAQLIIIDLNDVDNITQTFWTTAELGDNEFTTCHNIFIDEFGIAYLFGCNNLIDTDRRGALMLDLNTNPLNPTVVGQYTDEYVHDGFVRDNLLWASQIFDGTQAVVDVSDKSNPQLINKWTTPGAFTHNCWLNEEGTVLYTTDESSGQFVTAYDVTNRMDVRELDRIRSKPGEFVVPHNAFTIGNHVVVSYYTSGAVIIDATKPDNMVIVGEFDTAPSFEGGSFNGCWGVYPYLPSGKVLATDQQTDLWVLTPTYARAGYLEGTVSNAETGALLSGVSVDVLGSELAEQTSPLGEFKTGTINFGTFSVFFQKEGYEDLIVENVSIEEINTTILEVEMVPQTPFNLQVQVVGSNGELIPFADVTAVNEFGQRSVVADDNAVAIFENIFENEYNFIAGQWGFNTASLSFPVSDQSETITLTLNEGIYDDFIFDFGWEITSTAGAGNWELADPIGYSTNAGVEFEPSDDAPGDFGDRCLVTDSENGFPGPDDVDDGTVTVESPVFDLTTYNAPLLSFNRWFAAGGGQGTQSNDVFTVSITNATDTVVLDFAQFGDENLSQWVSQSYELNDFIASSDQMRVIVQTGDDEEFGHLVEAAFDLFKIEDLMPDPPSFIETLSLNTFEVSPNPVQGLLNIPDFGPETKFSIYSLNGALVKRGSNTQQIDVQDFDTGVYLLKVLTADGDNHLAKFIKD